MKKQNKITFAVIAALLMIFGIQWSTLDETYTLEKAMKQEAAMYEGKTADSTSEANK
jgi:hypothetical protein